MQPTFCTFMSLVLLINCESSEKPNIVLIAAEDLGWHDVSFHGSDHIMTPNIDILAYEGIILQKYYSEPCDIRARNALFTGKHPLISSRGDSAEDLLLPANLKELGYSTNLIGKRNIVGSSRYDNLITKQGFDTFYGFLRFSSDYKCNYEKTWVDTITVISERNGKIYNSTKVQSVDLFDLLTDRAVELITHYDTSAPLYLHISQAALHAHSINDETADSTRRSYEGRVNSLDKCVGLVIAALADKDLLDKTIIAFISTSGANSKQNVGSNLPLRGTMGAPWEGAVRTTAVIWQNSLESSIWTGLFHVTDWLPTLVGAASHNSTKIEKNIYGMNQWNSITKEEPGPRHKVLIGDDYERWVAIIAGHYKIIVGDVQQELSGYYNELNQSSTSVSYEDALYDSVTAHVFDKRLKLELNMTTVQYKRNLSNLDLHMNTTSTEALCLPSGFKGCLFDLSVDPAEKVDLWRSHPDLIKNLLSSFDRQEIETLN